MEDTEDIEYVEYTEYIQYTEDIEDILSTYTKPCSPIAIAMYGHPSLHSNL